MRKVRTIVASRQDNRRAARPRHAHLLAAATGTIADRRAFAAMDRADGLPDGLAVDAEGGAWVSLFGGGAIRRYAEDGMLDAVVPLPVTNPTCPAFGGPDLATLYGTSTRHKPRQPESP